MEPKGDCGPLRWQLFTVFAVGVTYTQGRSVAFRGSREGWKKVNWDRWVLGLIGYMDT